jgi:1-acyl-sn-glycerol-3-phosphate acyltransferase
MNQAQRKLVWDLVERILPADEIQRAKDFAVEDTGYGFDPFGAERESALLSYVVMRVLHKHWFRVQSHGLENIPLEGAALVVPNHSGVIAIDAAMLATDVFMNLERPRVVRAVVDYFTSLLPFVNVFFTRSGQLVGHSKNFEDLLRHDHLVGVFPEGARGVGKRFRQRYKLRRFNVGFVELSLIHKVPIIPTAIIGAEEQAPMFANIASLARLFHLPFFPITPFFPWLGPIGLIPLPSKYHISYGEAFRFYEEYPPETVSDSQTIRMLADKVQLRVQEMIEAGLQQRQTIYGLGLSRYFADMEINDDR